MIQGRRRFYDKVWHSPEGDQKMLFCEWRYFWVFLISENCGCSALYKKWSFPSGKLRICSYLLKKSLMENFIFVQCCLFAQKHPISVSFYWDYWRENSIKYTIFFRWSYDINYTFLRRSHMMPWGSYWRLTS